MKYLLYYTSMYCRVDRDSMPPKPNVSWKAPALVSYGCSNKLSNLVA